LTIECSQKAKITK